MIAQPGSTPQVTVVLSTYNRSNILGYAIESVVRQTLDDWELIVIGDACTDDSAAVVASFADSRIAFRNLDDNCGEQSGPNNVGVEMARGAYVAFLNHDDLFFPDHLASSLAAIERTSADLVFSAVLLPFPATSRELADDRWRCRLRRTTDPDGTYHPAIMAPISAWLVRRTLLLEVGPFRSARRLHVGTSQDFLFRAWRRHRNLRFTGDVTVLQVGSGMRRNTYADRQAHEHEYYRHQMVHNDRFRETALAKAAVFASNPDDLRGTALRPTGLAGRWLDRAALALGQSPQVVRHMLKHGRRGGLINALRRARGLEEI